MHSPNRLTASSEALPPWKRALDISCCILALPCLAVTAFWAALITRIASPGPILFRQERIGLNGRRFFLYKFRTMHVSASVAPHQAHFAALMKSNAPMQKLDARGDRRLIPGGWWLRVTGLDELPQVINVLRGEMSIVGPRPCIPYECDQYSPEQRDRLLSVPGITGLWQVSGKNRTTFEEMVRLDVAYAEMKSLPMDLTIILRTVPAIVMQVMDTRRARTVPAVQQPVTVETAASGGIAPQPVVTATFLANSQNVIVGAPEKSTNFPARPFAGTV